MRHSSDVDQGEHERGHYIKTTNWAIINYIYVQRDEQ